MKTFAKSRCQLYPVRVVPIVPGPAGADPDDGGAVVDVGGQVGVVRPVLLRDLLTLHHHLVINRGQWLLELLIDEFKMYLLIGLHDVAEVSLGHLPSIDPEAGSVEGDLDLLHVLDPELALLHLVQRQVEGALVEQDGAAGAAHVVPATLGLEPSTKFREMFTIFREIPY